LPGFRSHLCKPSHPPITEAEAEVYLAHDLQTALAATLRRLVNQRDWQGVALELRRWVYGGGRVLPELVRRRKAKIGLLTLNY